MDAQAKPNSSQLRASIKELIKAEKFSDALAFLASAADPWASYSEQHVLARLAARIDHQSLNLKIIRIGIVATSTVDHFVEILKLYLLLVGYRADVFIAEYNTINQTILDPNSRLYAFKPDFLWIFTGHRDVQEAIGHPNAEGAAAAVTDAVDYFTELWQSAQANSNAQIIQNNADLPAERVLGNFSGSTAWGSVTLLRRFNADLAAAAGSGVTVLDIDHISGCFGKLAWSDPRFWHHSKHAMSLDSHGYLAFHAARLFRAAKGESKKCIIVDLDNTLWGGVIGDDGVENIRLGYGSPEGEAFAAFQTYLRGLKDRGIILCACSKNEDAAARLPFEQHPHTVLRIEDFAIITANWNDKVQNIRDIAEDLEIGLNSIVFIDDNPVERELVSTRLPMVVVPDMPDDPALFIRTIDQLMEFETVTFSDEDRSRVAMYRDNADRKTHRKSFTDLGQFLRSLEMVATIGEFDAANLARISQLINKSNQFHLTTTRYTEAELIKFMADPDYVCCSFKLADKFGDNGLVSAVILKKSGEDLWIDTWVMSCRVLSRGMEEFILLHILKLARSMACDRILGRYVATAKNALVAQLYPRLGFQGHGVDGKASVWLLNAGQSAEFAEIFISTANV
jgi:FkbH-like protein